MILSAPKAAPRVVMVISGVKYGPFYKTVTEPMLDESGIPMLDAQNGQPVLQTREVELTGVDYEAAAFQRHFEVTVLPNSPSATLDEYAFLLIPDNDPRVSDIMQAATVELVLDPQGNATGVQVYPRLSASASPNPAAVNATVTITATLPADTPDTSVTFQVEGGQAYTEPVTQGQASHAYAFAQSGVYRIAVSSVHHGTAIVEVTIA